MCIRDRKSGSYVFRSLLIRDSPPEVVSPEILELMIFKFFPSLEKELFIKVVQFCDSLIPNPAEILSPKIKSFLSSAMIELEKIKTKINNFLYL